jgi:ABC-2 type transport system ATP-binding protein
MIEANDLRRTFKEIEAVAGIGFSVQRGEIYGLLGPNAAGKTTTIRMLTGQIDPTEGSAIVAGCDVVKDRARLKGLIGVVFEEQNLYDRLSARNNLRFNCWLYELPESRVDEVLDLVDLSERAKEPVNKFSNGMKQRLMIARALLHKPPVLFLDEPTRGLDPITARDIRGTIEQLRQEGTTILLTTHLLEEADHLCQHLSFIVNGLLVASGTPRDLKLSHGKRSVVLAILGAYTGQVTLVILYAVLGGCFSLALGLLIGAAFNTVGAAAAVEGPMMLIYMLAGVFVGPLADMFGNNPAIRIAKVFPTYYVSEGVYNASVKLGSFGSNMLDIGVVLGSTILLLVASAWVPRHQSAIAATI